METTNNTISVPDDWRERITLSVPVAGAIVGLSRNGSYDAANRGQLPIIILGRKKVVPVAPLRRLLGELPPLEGNRSEAS
ncbi:MAG: hypothetical protein WB565_18065 [Acidimicrobiales bacterium]